jgi:adenylate/nucleoside-diphosphate kinase
MIRLIKNVYYVPILTLFSRFKISTDFLNFQFNCWKEREDYQKGISILSKLSVINDVAERGVKLIQEYNSILTKDEKQKPFLLQVLNDYKTNYPDCKKKTLIHK